MCLCQQCCWNANSLLAEATELVNAAKKHIYKRNYDK